MNRRRTDAGQAVVEVALALPIVCTLAIGLLQIAAVVRHRLAIEVAAREAARAAVVSADPNGAAIAAAHAAITLRPLDVRVDTATVAGVETLTTSVVWLDPTDLPLVGIAVPDIALTARVTMAVEPP